MAPFDQAPTGGQSTKPQVSHFPIRKPVTPPQGLLARRGERGQRIAVVGSGISGLSAAWLLAERHEVTLFERDGRPGGHSHTVDLVLPEGRIAVDTGFIVFNERTYPNFTALLGHLGIASLETEMSFAASVDDGGFEYSGSSLNGLFAQRRNFLRPRMWRMIREILRFYREARREIGLPGCDVTLGEYLHSAGYGEEFVQDHLLPMGCAIWSTSARQLMDHPLAAFVRFCDNHGLMQVADRPQWRTVAGGSRSYVTRLLGDRRIDLRLNSRIAAVRRTASGPVVQFDDGGQLAFDAVVLATHADQSLALLDAPRPLEHHLLSAMRYQPNRAVLHGDTRFLPQRRSAWSSWNVLSGNGGGEPDPPICVSYWMNRLQHLPVSTPVIVTLNPNRPVRADMAWATFDYAHPLFDRSAMQAQRELWKLQGHGGVWFCGAYFGAGFHEDGLQAGLAVAEKLGGVRRPWSVAEPSGRIHLTATRGASDFGANLLAAE